MPPPRKAGIASAQGTVSGAGGGAGGGRGNQAQSRRSPQPPQQSQTEPKPKAQIPPQQTQTRSSARLPRPDSDSAEEQELGEEQRQESKAGAKTTTLARAQFQTQVHVQAHAKAPARSYTPDQRRELGEDPMKNMGKRERHDYHTKHGLYFRCGKHGHMGKDHDLGGRLYPLQPLQRQQQQPQRREVAAAVLGTKRRTAAGGGERQGRQLPPQGRGRGDQPSWPERERQLEAMLDTDTDVNITALAKQQVAVWEGDVAREDDRLAEGVGFGFAWERGPLSVPAPVPTETDTRTQRQWQRTQKRASAPGVGLRLGSRRGQGQAQPQSTYVAEVTANVDTANADARLGSGQLGSGSEHGRRAGGTVARNHDRERESSSQQAARSRRSQMQIASDRWVAAQPVPLLDAPVMNSGLRMGMGTDASIDVLASGFGSSQIFPGASQAVEIPEWGMGMTSGPGLGFSGVSASEDLLGLDLDAPAEQQQQGGGMGLDELMGLDPGGLGIDSALEKQLEHPSTGEVGGGVKALVELDLALGQDTEKSWIGAVREDELQEHEEDEGEDVGDEDGDGDDGIVVFRGRGKVEERVSASRDDE